MNNNDVSHEEILIQEWRDLIRMTAKGAHGLLQRLTDDEIRQLVHAFYDYMLQDPKAGLWLSSEQVATQLQFSMFDWLKAVLGSENADIPALVQRQYVVGQVHARIGLPIDLVARGARKLKTDLYRILQHNAANQPDEVNGALCFGGLVMDTAIEAMTVAYSPSYTNAMRDQERYRLLSVYDDVNVERERQLGALRNWENQFIYGIATGLPTQDAVSIARSEFGLWFAHKGKYLFHYPELVQRVDHLLLHIDTLAQSTFDQQAPDAEQRMNLLRQVRQDVEELSKVLASLFDELVKFENGKDPLTDLLNRRFIPTIMRREIALALDHNKTFTVAMLDVDLFKRVNDQHGHEAGDFTLKTIAAMIYDHVRSSDYVFRYGGEEFMVILTETTLQQATLLLEGLRRQIAAHAMKAGGKTFTVTVSIGLAEFNSHPDFQRVIEKADQALYQAKMEGRNRITGSQN